MEIKSREALALEISQSDGSKINDVVRRCKKNSTSFAQELQAEAPLPDKDGESKSTIADLLFREGVYLSDNAALGIKATPIEHISEKPMHVQYLFNSYMKEGITRFVLQKKEQMRQFSRKRRAIKQARTYASSDRGSANRPYFDTEVFNSESALEYPPMQFIIGDVRDTTSDAIRVIESDPVEAAQKAREWGEGAEIYVNELKSKSADAELKDVVAGVTYSHKQSVVGELNSQLLDEYMAEQTAEVINKFTKEAIVLMAETDSTAKDIGSGDAIDKDDIVDVLVQTPKRFMWTTVVGEESAVKSWLSVDRSSFYAGSNLALAAGSTVGVDTYIKAPTERIVIDVPTDYGLEADEFLLIDASEAILMFMLEGVELETTEFVNRKRMHEVIWSGSMGISQKYPSQSTANLRPFRKFHISSNA